MKRQIMALTVAILLVLNGRAWCAIRYTVTDLGLMGGSDSHAWGINNIGEVVGNYDVSYCSHAFLYDGNGPARELAFPGWTQTTALRINDSGRVVGYGCGLTNDTFHGFLYSGDDAVQDVGFSFGGSTFARGIDDAGNVVGMSYNSDSSACHAFLQADSGSAEDIGSLGGKAAWASSINNLGHVVGGSWIDASRCVPFLWTGSGPMQSLGSFGGQQGDANDINENDEVVGWSSLKGTSAPSNLNLGLAKNADFWESPQTQGGSNEQEVYCATQG
jgi:probable HAF family extracellular repeat protein